MSRRSPPQHKILSPLAVEDGFVVGWAWDPARPLLELVLAVDGVDAASGYTGQPVPDAFFALATPPSARCGFRLPLPCIAHDGRRHRLQVRVREWQAHMQAPKAALDWHAAPCFGGIRETAAGYLTGWVAFREALPGGRLPPVEVSEAGATRPDRGFDITLKADPGKKIDGCAVVGRFRVEGNRFNGLRAPVFSCLGQVLERELPAQTRKVIGELSGIGPNGLHGWAIDMANPLEQLDLMLVVDGLPVLPFRPHRSQPQLAKQLKLLPEELGICGFHVALPPLLRDGEEHRVEVLCRQDGSRVTKGPVVYRHRSGAGRHSELRRHSRESGNPASFPALRHSGESRNPVSFQQPSGKTLGPGFRRGDAPPAKPQASLIILNRNGAARLDELFASFLHHNSSPVELIVIDHASTDASLDRIRHWQRYLPIRLEALDRNDSFSASCNRGARLAKAPVLLFMNNDIVWLQDALPRILESLEQRNVGVVGVRLLKAEFERGSGALANANGQPQVQHLGVRFMLSGDQYLPYEVTPDDELLEAQYAPQRVGVVTGAVLACRRKQFLQIGGFDEQYHYGLEDVEFCLRLGATAGLQTVCRNDLVALHHHGYTRLTNRENGMLERQLLNQNRLSDKLGLWLKRAVWMDLLSGERQLAGELLTIGLALQRLDKNGKANAELDAALQLREQLQQRWPQCRVVLLAADADWDYVEDCHLLVAFSPWYDLRALKHPRRDLRTALYLLDAGQAAAWQANPSLHLYDCCLYRKGTNMREAAAALEQAVPAEAISDSAPLGKLPDSERLRVTVFAAESARAGAAQLLVNALRAQGAIASVAAFDEGGQRPLQRVSEVHITLFGPELAATATPFAFRRKFDVIDILWVLGGSEALRASDLAEPDEVWHGRRALPAHLRKSARSAVALDLAPKRVPRDLVQRLCKLVDKKIGRSFHTS